jgi:hypothetical protein
MSDLQLLSELQPVKPPIKAAQKMPIGHSWAVHPECPMDLSREVAEACQTLREPGLLPLPAGVGMAPFWRAAWESGRADEGTRTTRETGEWPCRREQVS